MSKIKISRLVEEMPPSGIRAFFDLVLGMKDIISLGVGEPDFTTPWNIRERAIYSLEEGYTSYTSNKGMVELRKEIAKFLSDKHSLDYDPEEEILITVGTSEGYDLAIRAIINPGDKVLIPSPSYVSYGPLVSLAQGVPVYLETKIGNDFKLKPNEILDAIDKKTKALVLNYPCNPTGVSYTKKELADFARVVKKYNLTVISDEIYDRLTYDFNHTPVATLAGMKERTIYLNGFSKAYAMTGWRVGYVCAPREIVAAMTKVHQYTIMCVPIMSQMAAIEALHHRSEGDVLGMKREYKRRREFIVDGLNDIGLPCHKPEGAFYVFPSVKHTRLSSVDFASALLKQEKVAVVPGVAFGKLGEGYIRISYASSFDNIKEALARMKRFIERL